MKNIMIRRASKKDLNDILRLNLVLFKKEFKGFDKTLNVNWTYSQKGKDYFNKRIISREGFVAVAVNNQEVIGYICGGLCNNHTRIIKKAKLENIIVTQKYRGQKIGSKLVKMFFEWCKDKKIKNILVTVYVSNSSGIKFYKKLGFNDYNLTLLKKLK